MRSFFSLVLAFLAGFIVAYLWPIFNYSSKDFSGIRPMQDKGFSSYPRYIAPIGEFEISKEGSYTYYFSGMPPTKMSLKLGCISGNCEQHANNASSTEISVRILDPIGELVCAAYGKPSAGTYEEQWINTNYPNNPTYYHFRCNDIKYSKQVMYKLELTIKYPDPNLPNAFFEVMFTGGGIESF